VTTTAAASSGTRNNRQCLRRIVGTIGEIKEVDMFLVRDIMYCKPGKVRPMVDKFLAMRKVSQQKGLGTYRVMTDLTAERFWMVVVETETPTMDDYEANMKKSMESKELQEIMKDYHDLVDHGRREIYRIEG
jgi:hypothetical protein